MTVIYKNRWAIACILLLSLVTADAQEDLRSQTNTFPLSSSEIAKAENFLNLTTGAAHEKKLVRVRNLKAAVLLLLFFLIIWVAMFLILKNEVHKPLLRSLFFSISFLLLYLLLLNFDQFLFHSYVMVIVILSKIGLVTIPHSMHRSELFGIATMLLLLFTLFQYFIVTYFIPCLPKKRTFGYLLIANLICFLVVFGALFRVV